MVFVNGKWVQKEIGPGTGRSIPQSSRSAQDMDTFERSSPYGQQTTGRFGQKVAGAPPVKPTAAPLQSFPEDMRTGEVIRPKGAPYRAQEAPEGLGGPEPTTIEDSAQVLDSTQDAPIVQEPTILTDDPTPTDQGWQPSTDTDLFGYDPVSGGKRSIVGDLQGQLGAWADLEGTFRQNYNWRNQGTPQTPKEAFMFLQQAQGSEFNKITFTQLSDTSAMVTRAYKVIQSAEYDVPVSPEMLRKAKEVVRINDYMGGRLYTRNGEVVSDPDDIASYDKMVAYKARAQTLVDQYRVGRQQLFDGAIKQGYAKELGEQSKVNAEAVAKIQKESAEEVANINATVDREIANIQKKTAEKQMTTQKDISAAEITGRESVADIQVKGALEVAKEQSRGADELEVQRGIQDVNRIRTQGKQDIANIQEKASSDMNLLTEEMSTRERMATREQDVALLKVDRESMAQQTLVQLSADLDMELETSKQSWQSAENDKEMAIQEGNLQEAIRSNFMQEQIALEQQEIERETNSLNMIMNVSQNPALLYFMKESGMLSGVGSSLLGQETESLINDLTASIDPGNLPNIQTYNAMSELQQQISAFRTGATTGMSPEAQQEHLQGASPFTRGQRSSIRVGSRANPFETMNA